MAKKHGFTLIELVIVVLVIGIVASFVVPGYFKTIEKTKQREAILTAKLIAAAERNFYLDKNAYYPLLGSSMTPLTVTSPTSINNALKIAIPNEIDWKVNVTSGVPVCVGGGGFCSINTASIQLQRQTSNCRYTIVLSPYTTTSIPEPEATGNCVN